MKKIHCVGLNDIPNANFQMHSKEIYNIFVCLKYSKQNKLRVGWVQTLRKTLFNPNSNNGRFDNQSNSSSIIFDCGNFSVVKLWR